MNRREFFGLVLGAILGRKIPRKAVEAEEPPGISIRHSWIYDPVNHRFVPRIDYLISTALLRPEYSAVIVGGDE